jgi:hypothetical protein
MLYREVLFQHGMLSTGQQAIFPAASIWIQRLGMIDKVAATTITCGILTTIEFAPSSFAPGILAVDEQTGATWTTGGIWAVFELACTMIAYKVALPGDSFKLKVTKGHSHQARACDE